MGRPSPRLADEKKRSYVEEANSEESDAEASGASSGEAEAEEDDSASDYSEEQPQPKRRGRPPGASSSSAPKAKAAPRKSTGGSGPGEDLSLQAAIAASLRSVACGGCSSETCAATAGGAAPAGGADPSFRPTPKNHTGTYCVQYASTGRAKCITCGEIIEKNSLRTGIEINESRGQFMRWQHLECSRLPTAVCKLALENPATLPGFTEMLTDADTDQVLSHT